MRTENTEKTWRPTDNQLPYTDFHYRNPQPMQLVPFAPDEPVEPTPTVDWEAFRAEWSRMGRTLTEGITQMAQAWRAILTPWLEQVGPLLQRVNEVAWTAYEDAGAPYGERSDGMLRWLREEHEANNLRTQAEAIEQRHRDLAQLRQWGKDMRTRRAARIERAAQEGAEDGHGTDV